MKLENRYVDLVLCRDDEGAPILAIGPRWSVEAGEMVDIEIDGKTYLVKTEHVSTVTFEDEVYNFVAACHGDNPKNAIVLRRYVPREMNWDHYKDDEEEAKDETV